MSMIKIVLTREEAVDYLLCEQAVLRYLARDTDSAAFERYLPGVDAVTLLREVSGVFRDLREGVAGENEYFTLATGPVFNNLKWVMYRFVFDRDYSGVVGTTKNPPLESMGIAYYTMFWELARKLSRADRRVVRLVY